MYQKAPRTLTEIECELLLKELRLERGSLQGRKRSYRNHLAALLMLDAGLRVAEVVGLVIADLVIYDEPVDRLLIRREIAKGGRERTVPMSSRLKIAVRTCYNYFWDEPANHMDQPAFPGTKRATSLTTKQIERIIILAAVSSLHRRVTPHMLRHTFATRLMRKTNIRVVQELLGHKNLASTQIYTHPDQEDLDNAIKSI